MHSTLFHTPSTHTHVHTTNEFRIKKRKNTEQKQNWNTYEIRTMDLADFMKDRQRNIARGEKRNALSFKRPLKSIEYKMSVLWKMEDVCGASEVCKHDSTCSTGNVNCSGFWWDAAGEWNTVMRYRWFLRTVFSPAFSHDCELSTAILLHTPSSARPCLWIGIANGLQNAVCRTNCDLV